MPRFQDARFRRALHAAAPTLGAGCEAGVSTVLAAVVGGGVTAAVLLGAGVVDSGDDHVTVIEPPLVAQGLARRSPPSSRRRAQRARDLRARRARRRLHPRPDAAAPSPSPFDVVRQRADGGVDRLGLRDRRATGLILTNAHVVEAATDDPGHVLRRPHGQRASRSARTPTPTSRCCASTPTALDLHAARARRLRRRPGRRPDGRDRQPVRARAHAHHRRRLRAPAPAHRARAASRSTT